MCGSATASQTGIPEGSGAATAQVIAIAESQTEESDADEAGEAESGADDSDVSTESFECEGGETFEVRFDNS